MIMMHKNLKDNLFVAIQFILFVVFFLRINLGNLLPDFFKIPGIILFVFGSFIVFVSILQLDKNLTAFPTPKDKAELYTGGLYQFARHPIYTGVIFTFLGMSLFWLSWYKVLITIILIILFWFKSTYEESQLIQKFPNYVDYKKTTPRFFPGF